MSVQPGTILRSTINKNADPWKVQKLIDGWVNGISVRWDERKKVWNDIPGTAVAVSEKNVLLWNEEVKPL